MNKDTCIKCKTYPVHNVSPKKGPVWQCSNCYNIKADNFQLARYLGTKNLLS